MKKLKLQMQLTVDGYVSGPNGELDWMVWNWDDPLKQYVNDLTGTIDTIIMGHNLAEGFIPYWKNVANNPADEQYAFGKIMHETPKIVFSKSPEKNEWENTTINSGDLVTEVNNLKKQDGKNIMTYGGARYATSLIKNNLVDEFYLFVNPTAIGQGLTIFNGLTQKMNLKLVKAISFECGIVLFHYQPLK